MSTFDVQQENRVETILDDLAVAGARVHELREDLGYAEGDRDHHVREARGAGAKIAAIASASGLSVSQVNNILGNRK